LPWWPCSLVLHSLLSCRIGTVGIRKTVTPSPSPVFVLLGRWRALPLPLPTSWIRLHRTATPSLAGTLSAPSAGTLLPLTGAGTSTAEWLSSPGDSPRPPPAPAIYSTVANLALGYAVSWYSTTSLAHAKVRSVADYRAPRPCQRLAP